MSTEILYRKECYLIQGAIYNVYKKIGCGFLESIYQECLEIEFAKQEIPFISQPSLRIEYQGELLSQQFKPDFICFDLIIVELKVAHSFAAAHTAQVLNYLRASNLQLGLLVNFGSYPKVQLQRILN